MSLPLAVAGAPSQETEVNALAVALGLPVTTEASLLLYRTEARLELRETGAGAAGPVYADFASGRAEYRRRHGGGRGQPLARAVGLRGAPLPSVLDATAGLGRDAFVLASLGATVTLLERSPVVGALLADALQRARQVAEVAPIVARMTLYVADGADALAQLPPPDVVYLDPMYPHGKGRALQKKEMRLFRNLVGDDDDAPKLLEAARRVARQRVVVKRPQGAPFLGEIRPNAEIASKNTRYDLYF